MKHGAKYLAALAAAIIILSSTALAATISVRSGESIQAAINGANPNDTISVQSGVYRESLNITKPINLAGIGRPLLDGGAINSAIILQADGVSVSGFDIRTMRRTGIHVRSYDNIIENNTISGCLDGIRLDHSRTNNIFLNDINNVTIQPPNQNPIFLLKLPEL